MRPNPYCILEVRNEQRYDLSHDEAIHQSAVTKRLYDPMKMVHVEFPRK